MALYLSGGGNAEQSAAIDTAFISALKKKKIVYLPIAMPQEVHTWTSCYEWLSDTLSSYGQIEIDMWTSTQGKTLKNLSAYDALYIGGGNTYDLLAHLQKSKFISVLRKWIATGGTVYGGSAGAIILGKTIQTAKIGDFPDENKASISVTDGLSALGNRDVHCHYKEQYDQIISEYVVQNNRDVIAIPETAGLEITDGKWQVHGSGIIYLFTRDGKISISESKLSEK